MGKNIVLTGFMGCGKTTIGKRVAQELGLDFLDTDVFIEQQEHMKISDIFSEKGEEYFREIESHIAVKSGNLVNSVIATGGGIVLRPQNIDYLRTNGLIVCLKADIDTILKNTSHDHSRPLLNTKDTRQKIKDMLEQRANFYQNNDYEIDVSRISVEEAVEKVKNIYSER